MIALVDCNNFYASCERLFRPELNGQPVVVLSNNDGCVIARSQEAKDLGIRMGTPWFQIDRLTQAKITKFSSNYTLYADISARVMNNLARYTPQVEVYSIDECFLNLKGFDKLTAYATEIRHSVIHNTGIPVSIGVAPSKTLAKLANKVAKKSSGVCVLSTPEEIKVAVDQFPLEDLWGIGPAYFRKLYKTGIETAGQLRDMPLTWVQKNMTIQGARLWYELWGKSMIQLDSTRERKKGICTSRSFGKLTGDYQEIEEAAASYAHRLSEKLREDRSCATILSVKLITNRFRTDLPQISPSITISLLHPTNSTVELVSHAVAGVKRIYCKGYQFLKVELFATGLIPENEVQLNLLHEYKGNVHAKVSQVMDKLNKHYGRGTLRVAAEGYQNKWTMRRDFLSPSYTTKWEDILRTK